MPSPTFQERLVPSSAIVLALGLSGPMVLLAALPFGLELAILLSVITPISLITAARLLSPMTVVDGSLRAGRIRVPLKIVDNAEAFSGEEARLQRGPLLDARARLAIRGDVDPVVKIWLSDPEDPTPYLLVSTRKPDQLVAALRANRP